MNNHNLFVVAVETSHIQSYIFGSNRLKENIGASFLVAEATGQWGLACITEITDSHNLTQHNGRWSIVNDITIETESIEVMYSGGGNLLTLFRQEADAKEFIRKLSRRVIKDAPGLSLTFLQDKFNWKTDILSEKVSDLLKNLKQARSKQPLQRGVGGLGVTMKCKSSSLPATYFEPKNPENLEQGWDMYSSEVQAKRKASDNANGYLRDLLEIEQLKINVKNADASDFKLSNEIDSLGRSKGENSFIAVVHADGNGLGLLIQNLKNNFPDAVGDKGNRAYIDYMRNLSQQIKHANTKSQQAMLDRIALSIQHEEDKNGEDSYYIKPTRYDEDGNIKQNPNKNSNLKLTLHKDEQDDKWILPIRPLVSGGDDVTFVCDGRIACDLTVTFLHAFEHYTRELLGHKLGKIGLDKLTACAGIAIVKSHYPFARAYDLAEDLASNAKQMVNKDADLLEKAGEKRKIRYSALDWHFTTGGLYDDIEGIRKREYPQGEIEIANTAYPTELTMRPIFLTDKAHDFRNWETVKQLTEDFQTKWANSRNKAKGLMDALRQGDVEVEVFNLRYLDGDLSLPTMGAFHDHYGWQASTNTDLDGNIAYCGYYDSLELLDIYLALKENSYQETSS